jgi:putative CocE/NonD family hydrolase
LKPGERVPVLMRTTRYWRGSKLGWGLRMLVALHQLRRENLVDKQRAYFNQRRFAVIVVDARGSGASGGHRVIEYSPAEVADLGEVAAWASVQPWSNGRIGTFGVSYDGNTAELAAASNQPAIQAVMPLYDDFDVQALIQPGGVPLRGFVQEWSDMVAAMDRNDVCAVDGVQGWSCWKDRQMIPGVRPVDADPHGKHLAELVKEHHNVNVAESVGRVEFRDEVMVTPEGKFGFKDISPYGLRRQIEASGVPMMVWCGWLDANPCEGALIRFRTFSNPQVVIIGPLSHGGNINVDPFATSHQPPVPPRDEQFKMEAEFFDRVLGKEPAEKIESLIQYYTMGEGAWHTTKVWPPEGLTAQRFYFAEGHTLSGSAPRAKGGRDSYTVDFTASSGKQTRWHTQLGGGDVVYPDRAAEDKKLLTYTSPPLDANLEITGSPVLTLEMASTTSDGAIHAYLEDVSPQGRVTYLHEGVFRVIHRKEVDPKSLPYEPLGPAHSFLRADAEPLTPGEPATIRFSFFPTSVLLRKAHSIRLALAGADASLFQRYPAEGTPTWNVYREAQRASFVELPGKRHLP